MKIIYRLTMVAICALLAGCSKHPKNSSATNNGQPDTYDIPHLSQWSVKGNGADWAQQGFRIDVLGELRPHAKADANQAPSVRLGWTDQGLAFLVTVHDTTPIEADDDKLWLHDSVELMVSDATIPAQHFWLLVAPGMDPLHPQLRWTIADLRTDKTSPPNLTATVASAKTDDGYTVEGLLPFANLNMTGQPGAELGLQICVNDRISQRDRMLYRWVPTDEALEHPKLYRHVRLAQQPSPPITLAANGEYVGRRGARIRINDAQDGNKTIAILDDHNKILASAQNSGPGRIEINLPMPADDQAYGPLTVTRDSKEMARIDLGQPQSRQQFLRDAEFRFNTYLFVGSVFPAGDYLDPSAVEDVVGPYTLRTKYYDADFHEVTRAAKPGRYGAIVQIQTKNGLTDTRFATLYCSPRMWTNWQLADLQAGDFVLPDELGIAPQTLAAYASELNDLWKWNFGDEMWRSDAIAVLLCGMAESDKIPEPVVQRTGTYARNRLWWVELKKRLGMAQDYPYVLRLPRDYESQKDRKFPLLIYLHGAGDRGDDLSIIEKNLVSKFLAKHQGFPFILVAPQCPAGDWWNPPLLISLLDQVEKKYRVDPDRVYLMGMSMGGIGTWTTATWYPQRFAAIVPICGYGDPEDMARLKNLPIWVFHGDEDNTVPYALDVAGVEALKKLGGNVKMTVYPGVAHEAWQPTYANPDIYQWLLEQHRPQP